MHTTIVSSDGAAAFLAACAQDPEATSSAGGIGDAVTTVGTTDTADTSATETAVTTLPGPTGPEPGTQQDLVVNIGDRVLFNYDQYAVRADQEAVLQRLAGWMRPYGNIALTLAGHADEPGTREYNLALGERRAKSVKDYLASLGVGGDRLFVVSFGKERPAVLGANEAAWEQNRRSVFVIR